MIVDEGKIAFNSIIGNRSSPEDIEFGLYTNTVTWDHETEFADLDEAAWSGYARVVNPEWDNAVIGAANRAIADADPPTIEFANTSGSPQVANGWFMFLSPSGLFLGGGPFPAPIAFDPIGARSFTPKLITDTI